VNSTRVRPVTFAVVAWIFVLAAIGGFQFFRGELVDGLVFTIIAAALIADAFGLLKRIEKRRWGVNRWFVGVTAVAAAAVMIITPRHGVADLLLFAVIGLLALAYAWPNPSGEATTQRRPHVSGVPFRRSAWLWAIVGIAACLWELTVYLLGNLLPGGRTSHPALSDVLDPLVDGWAGRIVFVALWIVGGIALLRRAAER
jgi:hypothetical protein